MNASRDKEDFVELITSFQGRLFGYLLSILGNPDQANEVLQETNLILWKKSDEFSIGTSFKAWSFRVASLQAMAFRQRQLRDRLVFDDELFEQLVQEATHFEESEEDQFAALQVCLENLPAGQHQLVSRRYIDGLSIRDLAVELGKKENAVIQALYRIRGALFDCIQQRLPEGT